MPKLVRLRVSSPDSGICCFFGRSVVGNACSFKSVVFFNLFYGLLGENVLLE